MTTDPIAAARALIEPLTGYTPEPWEANINDQYGSIMVPLSGWDGDFKPADARLIAAAPDLRDMVATLADALEAERAKVAAAYEAAGGICKRRYRDYEQMVANAERSGPSHLGYVCDSTFHHWSGKSSAYSEMATDIRALTPADAQAALDKMLAEARLEGWRAGREAAAKIVDGTARYHMTDPDDIEVVRLTAAEIRALLEPKEASHD